MVVYYVDSIDGNDTNSGQSMVFPWKTVSKVNAMTFLPADWVMFRRGEVFPGRLTPISSGMEGQNIIYGAYGIGDRPVIDGTTTTEALYLPLAGSPAHHLEFHDIYFRGGSTVVCRVYTHNVLMEDCRVAYSGSLGYGIASSATTANYIHDNTFRRCEVDHNGKSGIVMNVSGPGFPYNMIIEDCDVHHNGTDGSGHHGIYVDAGVIVRRNKCHHNTSAGIKNNSEFGIDMRYLPFVYDNEIYNNANGICMAHNYATVWNNLIYNNTAYNVQWEAGTAHCLFYYNTLVNASSPANCRGMYFSATLPHNNIIKNNLIVQDSAVVARECLSAGGNGRLVNITANNTFDYNLYYWNGDDNSHMFIDGSSGTNVGWTEWKALVGSPDAHGHNLKTIPDFVSRYTNLHPTHSGNLKGLGVAILGFTIDRDGRSRTNPPTPGCYDKEGTIMSIIQDLTDVANDVEAQVTLINSEIAALAIQATVLAEQVAKVRQAILDLGQAETLVNQLAEVL